ncbi:segregation and condensation protein A [Agrilactobacillus fermenti]|uniref:segregation and condensation protein A n=1 Tax=Agrilactobacillus fermenti TaxID=2586909 RepID=UPI003A5C06F0
MAGLNLVLPEFEGPLDLLLYLIKVAKIDIYDIPIAEITNQYLTYLHDMRVMQLDTVGDYLVMASNLMAIKSKMLLPKPEPASEADDEFELDPRDELVSQLLSYQAYKQLAGELRVKAETRRKSVVKEPSQPTGTFIIPLQRGAVDLTQLTQAMNVVLRRHFASKPQKRAVQRENISIQTQIKKVLTHLEQHHGYVQFSQLLEARSSDKVDVIENVVTTFLAVLELMKNGRIVCEQTTINDDILVKQVGTGT